MTSTARSSRSITARLRHASRAPDVRAGTVFAWVALTTVGAAHAGGSERPPALSVAYTAPGNCPTEDDFERRVRERTSRARFSDEPNAWSLDVRIRPAGVTYAGHLSIVAPGWSSERDVEDVSCSEVVDALALVSALSVDPNASLMARPATSTIPPLEAPAKSVPLVTPIDSPIQGPTLGPEPDRASASGRGRAWTASLGVAFVTTGGVAPDPLAGAALFGELESRRRSWLAPSVRLGVSAQENGAYAPRSASFGLLAGRADACPARVGSAELTIRLCVGLDLGAIRAEGIAVPLPRTGVDFWSDAVAVLRARWAPNRWPVFVELEGGGAIAFTRPEFDYEVPGAPGQPSGARLVDQPLPFAPMGSLAAGWRLW